MKKVIALFMALVMTVSVFGAATAYADCGLDFSVYTLDGYYMHTAANDKPKLLIFFKTGCINSAFMIDRFQEAVSLDEVDVLALDVGGSSDAVLEEYRNDFGSPGVVFGSARSSVMWSYLRYAGYSPSSMDYPAVFYLDANNDIVHFTTNMDMYILEHIEEYLGVSIMRQKFSGDVNDDGEINMKDPFTVLKCVTNGYCILSKEEYNAVLYDDEDIIDVNCDGVGNIKDAILLLKYVTGEDVKIY